MPPKTIPFNSPATPPKTIPFGSSTSPVQPIKQPTANPYSGKGIVGQVTDFATSFASGVGQDVVGVMRTANKIVGATIGSPVNKLIKMGTGVDVTQKADEALAKFSENVYQKPFAGSLGSIGGKVGAVAEKVAPYLVTGGAGGAIRGASIAQRLITAAPTALMDTAIGTAQAQGDIKAGLASGVSSLAGYGLIPGKGGLISQTLKGGTLPGYISDVATGLAGQRGEDKTGAKAFIPGAGTALGTVVGGALARKTPAYKEFKETKTISKRMKVFNTLERDSKAVSKAFAGASSKGMDAKDVLAKTNLLNGAVDTNGTISSQKALENFDEFISPYEGRVRESITKEGAKVNFQDLKKQYLKGITSSTLQGDARTTLVNKAKQDLRGFLMVADKEGNIPLEAIHDSKVFKMKHNNYLDPSTGAVTKENARILKKIVEDNTQSLDVKGYNEELSKLYGIRGVLLALDKKKVEGGRLGKHFATVVGGVVGGHFGPFGAILGAEVGSLAKGQIMKRALGGNLEAGLKPSQKMTDIIQENSFGSRNTTQSNTIPAMKATIAPTILPPTPKRKPVTPITNPEQLLEAPKPPAIPMGGIDAQGRKIDATGELIVPPQPKKSAQVVPAKKQSYQDKKTGRFARGYTSEAGMTTPKTMLGAGLGSLSGFEKDENGKWKYNATKGLAGAGLGAVIGNKGKMGLSMERVIKPSENIRALFFQSESMSDFIAKMKRSKEGASLNQQEIESIYDNFTAGRPPEDSHLAKAQASLREAKGLSASDIMAKHPDINLKRDVPITDVRGNKATIPAGEALTPYELKGNKVLLQDGETYIVSKNQWQNIKGNAVSGEAKEFAPELKGTEETVKGAKDYAQAVNMGEEGAYESLPPKIRTIIEKYSDDAGSYEANNKMIAELKKEGWTADYGLSGDIQTMHKVSEGSPTKYSQYTLPDGKNYKEVLIKAPEQSLNLNELREKGWKIKEVGEDVLDARTPDGEYIGRISKMALNESLKGMSATYFKSSHWDEPNVLAHLRLNERTYKGKPVTFMEELQSDWARELRAGKDVPQNPALKNWQTLSVKRALKEAVDNNSEYFAWINGEQTSARYNLATHVKEVKWEKGATDTKRIILSPKESLGFSLDIKPSGEISDVGPRAPSEWVGKKLDEVLGKGLADSIMSKESGTLSGEGLKFGGEWANTLYDKQVKNIVEDVTGGKVEMMDLGLPVEKNTTKFIIQGGRDAGGTLTKGDLKVGLPINIDSSSGARDYIITDVLGDGKFKAVPKSMHGTQWHDQNEKTFDISTKTTTQQGIRLTPEIVARIKGEALPIKKASGKLPFLKQSNATKQP